MIDERLGGASSSALMVVVHSSTKTVADPAFAATIASVEQTLRGSKYVRAVVPPAAGMSISRDGHIAIVQGNAAGNGDTLSITRLDRLDRLGRSVLHLVTLGAELRERAFGSASSSKASTPPLPKDERCSGCSPSSPSYNAS